MEKQLKFKYKNVEYTLEYTRKTVEQMERQGFLVDEVTSKPMTMLPALFAGAFKAHHKNIAPQLVKEIYDHITDRGELIGKLAEMYNEPIMALMDEPEESAGNLHWTASW